MKLKKNEVLVLRDVHADMTSHGGFAWPEKGYVEAPDWNMEPECGNGLHGHLWGAGGDYFISSGEGRYLVVRVNCADIVDLGDKVKFRRGYVVFCGSLVDAVKIVANHAPANTAVNESTQTAGYKSTQTAGYKSTQTAGVKSVQIQRWYDGEWRVACRIVTEKEADKPYLCNKGEWIEVTK